MEHLADPNIWLALTALTALEIVLGIDNIVFIAILAGRLPEDQQAAGRRVGLAQQIWVMVTAIVIAVGVMIVMADMVSAFIEKHPTVKMLALSFLLLVGLALIGDGVDLHIPRGYIYFAMGFSVFVEVLNLRIRGRKKSAA